MLLRACKIFSFWRFRGDFICRLCHAGSTRAEGGPRRAFPPLIFVGRAASRPVGAACPAAGLPPVRRLYCFGAGGVGRPARLILLWRASAAFYGLDGHKARLRPQSLAYASPQRIIRCRSPDAAGPLGVGMVGAGVCCVLLLRRAQSPLSVAKPCIRLASANHPAPRGPERPALGCGDVGMMSARACPRRLCRLGRRGRWVLGLPSAALPPWAVWEYARR